MGRAGFGATCVKPVCRGFRHGRSERDRIGWPEYARTGHRSRIGRYPSSTGDEPSMSNPSQCVGGDGPPRHGPPLHPILERRRRDDRPKGRLATPLLRRGFCPSSYRAASVEKRNRGTRSQTRLAEGSFTSPSSVTMERETEGTSCGLGARSPAFVTTHGRFADPSDDTALSEWFQRSPSHRPQHTRVGVDECTP